MSTQNNALKSRVTSFAPQFVVDDLARSIAHYQKLGFTFGEPDRLGHNYIGTEHLLLGILSEPETAAGQILTAYGIERAVVREEIARLTKPGSSAE